MNQILRNNEIFKLWKVLFYIIYMYIFQQKNFLIHYIRWILIIVENLRSITLITSELSWEVSMVR